MRIAALFVMLASMLVKMPAAEAQIYDPKTGYIFEQSYVTRIKEEQASTMLGIPDVGNWLLDKHERHPRKITYPHAVRHQTKQLIFRASGRAPLQLVDWSKRATKTSEGDGQKFVFLETVGNYYLVCVEFEHDAPGFLLIEKNSLKTYFVHQ